MAKRRSWADRSSSCTLIRSNLHRGCTARSPGRTRLRWASLPGRSWRNCRCSSADIRSRPASSILHSLVRLKEFGVTTFQAEDEIAAICAAIGAAYAGHLGVTSSSGPGIALKGEAMGLAVMTELPLVIVNSQRGGPSAPACRPRPSRATSIKRSMAAMAMRRSRWSRRAAPAMRLNARSRPAGSRYNI